MESPPESTPLEEKEPALRISPAFAGVAAAGLLIGGIALGCFYPRRPVQTHPSPALPAAASGVWPDAYAKLAWDITAKHGWHDAHLLLNEILPEMVRNGGARVELREIAIAALGRMASATIPSPSNVAILISPDERWLILNGLNALLFFDIEHPDGNFYMVPAEARRLYANGQDLIYEERGQWKQRAFKEGDLSHYQLEPAQEISKPPAPLPANLPPSPLQARIDQKGMVRLYDSISTPVRILGEVQAKMATISPRGRWLVIQETTGVIRLWDLAKLRREMANLHLDWPIPPLKSRAYSDRPGAGPTLAGEEVTQIQPARQHVPDQVVTPQEKERPRVILPSPKKGR